MTYSTEYNVNTNEPSTKLTDPLMTHFFSGVGTLNRQAFLLVALSVWDHKQSVEITPKLTSSRVLPVELRS